MSKSTDHQYQGEVVTVTEKGTVIQLCRTLDYPSKKKYPALIQAMGRRIPHAYKYLVWSPTTESNPRKYKWRKKGGGYQGLQSTEI